MRMRDITTGLPLFTSLSVQLACRKCIDEGKAAACVHMLHLVPRWQSSDRHVKLKTIMQVFFLVGVCLGGKKVLLIMGNTHRTDRI